MNKEHNLQDCRLHPVTMYQGGPELSPLGAQNMGPHAGSEENSKLSCNEPKSVYDEDIMGEKVCQH